MPAFHALFFEWLELSEAPAAAVAAANATVAAVTANATAANATAAAAASVPDLGEWLLGKGHNITDKLWGLAQPVLAASAAKALKDGYDAYCAAGHPYDYWRRRRMGWWIGRLAAWADKDEDGEEGGDGD